MRTSADCFGVIKGTGQDEAHERVVSFAAELDRDAEPLGEKCERVSDAKRGAGQDDRVGRTHDIPAEPPGDVDRKAFVEPRPVFLTVLAINAQSVEPEVGVGEIPQALDEVEGRLELAKHGEQAAECGSDRTGCRALFRHSLLELINQAEG